MALKQGTLFLGIGPERDIIFVRTKLYRAYKQIDEPAKKAASVQMAVRNTTSSSGSSSGRTRKPVTQKQIAQQVGVTQQLVALALQNSPRVADATRARIWDAARQLGYSPNSNRHARVLAAKRHGTPISTDILAVIFEPLKNSPATSDPYFMPLVDGIEIEAGRRGYDLFLMPARTTGLPWLIREGWIDGVILLGAHPHLYGLEELSTPVVTLGSALEGVAGLTPRDEEGAYLATRHLLHLGHRRIAYLGPGHWPSATARFAGYRRALQESGLPFTEELVENTLAEPMIGEAQSAMARLLGRARFTGLVCHNDPVAMGAIQYATSVGLQVPRDLSVTGFDDVSEQYHFQPPLTSVAFAGIEMGRRAVQMLCEEIVHLTEQETTAAGQETFPVMLKVRASTAHPPSSTPNGTAVGRGRDNAK
jgi:LacI family transcriptional regulator